MQVWFKCNYDNDELHGEYILYDKKGELEAKRFYENGKLVKTQRPFKKRIIRLLKGDF